MKVKWVKLKKSDPIFNSGFMFTNRKIINRNMKTTHNSEDGQNAESNRIEKVPSKGRYKDEQLQR